MWYQGVSRMQAHAGIESFGTVAGGVGTTLKVILVADLAGSAVPGDIVVIGASTKKR